ncbi:hypothetical protein [Ascidiaceihabitans sp.]|uniref:hypothetical protein n=2 Tax=Ascidiaceihabitans sp. TaxID=1872644 RepID=UPI0032998DF2
MQWLYSSPYVFWTVFAVLMLGALWLYLWFFSNFLGWYLRFLVRAAGFMLALAVVSFFVSLPITLPLIGLSDSLGFDPDIVEELVGLVVLFTMPLTLILRHQYLKRQKPKN